MFSNTINKWGIEIGHPIVPSTNKMADCGARNFELPKIVRIEEPTSAEMDEWRKCRAPVCSSE